MKMRALPFGAALAIMLCVSEPLHAESVSTIAGNGIAGLADGQIATASFLLPLGVASDSVGHIYVSDAAAQRIRIVENGIVRTIAGGGDLAPGTFWVPGALVEGTGAQARFNRPWGIAVGNDGTIFVADSYNNVIRKISPDGEVSALASVQFPTGLAIDASGLLYVVSYNGPKLVEPNGNVSTMPFPLTAHGNWGIAIGTGPRGRKTIYLADANGLYARRSDGQVEFFRSERVSEACAATNADARTLECGVHATPTVGNSDVGSPFGLAAVDDHRVAFTDARSHVVRLIDIDTGTIWQLAGPQNFDGSARDAGYADGSEQLARFSSPAGIARMPDGSFVVADAGDRHLRRIAAPESRVALIPSRVDDVSPQPTRVAYAGDAEIWPGVAFESTIGGRIERRLSGITIDSLVLAKRGADPIESIYQMSNKVLPFKVVILQVQQTTLRQGSNDFTALKAVADRLALHATKLVIVYIPDASEISPTEALWSHLSGPSRLNRIDNFGARVKKAVGVPVIDMTAQFRSAARKGFGPVYSADGIGLAPLGRDEVAAKVSRSLTRLLN